MISVTELAGAIPGLTYRAATTYSDGENWALYYRVAASYVTGAHSFKVGFNNGSGSTMSRTYNYQPVSYTFRDGVPQQLTQWATPYSSTTNLDNDLGDLRAGQVDARAADAQPRRPLRLHQHQHARADARARRARARTARRRFAAQNGLSWHDITPKTGLAYDLFGNGRTAVKVVLSKYLQGQLRRLAGQLNPVSTLVTSADAHVERHQSQLRPDCDLLNAAANGECLALNNTELRHGRPRIDLRSGADERLGQAQLQLGVLGERAAAAARARRRWTSATSAAGTATSWSPTIARCRPPTSTRSRSPRRSIRACRTAAARPSVRSTTSSPARFTRAGRQLRDAVGQLRPADSALERRRRQRQRAAGTARSCRAARARAARRRTTARSWRRRRRSACSERRTAIRTPTG